MTARKTPKTEPVTITDRDRELAVLGGVTTTAAKPAAARTPKPKPANADPKPAEPTAPAATNGAVKAANAGPKPNEVKRELATLVVQAAGEAIKALPEDELVQVFGGATPEALAAQVSQWLHYLPLGGVWPEGYCPKPDRSDWR